MLEAGSFTPKVLVQMRAEGVVFAYGQKDLDEADRSGLGQIYNAGMTINKRIEEWQETDTWLPSWTLLEGARVLDLASGSAKGDRFGDASLNQFVGMLVAPDYPHFARLCALNGAAVVALDKDPQSPTDQRLFTGVSVDLIEAVRAETLGALPALRGRTFDIISSTNFVGQNNPPGFAEQLILHDFTYTSFEQALVDQLKPFMAEGGIMDLDLKRESPTSHPWYRKLTNTFYYRKVEGQVTEVDRRY